jgi:hypothetical protein
MSNESESSHCYIGRLLDQHDLFTVHCSDEACLLKGPRISLLHRLLSGPVISAINDV